MSVSFIDILIIISYFVVVLFIGFYLAREKKGTSTTTIDYLLAGRKVTLPFFVATLVATWYGNILGMGEFIYSAGIAGWFCFAFPYYIAAFLFALFVSRKIREYNVRTIPEQIILKYGKKAGWISSFLVLIITIPAVYILLLGVMLSLFTGWPLWISIIIGSVVSLVYLYTGGFKADVLTNAAQFIIMYIGFAILVYFIFSNHGSVSTMLENLPDDHKVLTGNYSWQYILSWFIIALQTFVDPSFHQRCSAAESPKVARKGILISICCWIIFDTMTLMAGLYAKAYYNIDNPLMAYTVIAESVLPVVWKGIFITSLLAVIMSSLDSFAFLSAATIGNDILKPLKKYFSYLREFSTKALIRFGLILSALFSILMAISLPSAVELIYKTASIAIPGLLVPVLLSFSKKFFIEKKHAVIIMIASSGTSLIWTIGKVLINKILIFKEIFSGFEPMIPGILVSLILLTVLSKKIKDA
jgi:solute:Na+ symporter, SSS family